jgi:hypothetical protein
MKKKEMSRKMKEITEKPKMKKRKGVEQGEYRNPGPFQEGKPPWWGS